MKLAYCQSISSSPELPQLFRNCNCLHTVISFALFATAASISLKFVIFSNDQSSFYFSYLSPSHFTHLTNLAHVLAWHILTAIDNSHSALSFWSATPIQLVKKVSYAVFYFFTTFLQTVGNRYPSKMLHVYLSFA